MELWELGKKINYALAPLAAFGGLLRLFAIEPVKMILPMFLFAVTYLLIWHEIRIRQLERW